MLQHTYAHARTCAHILVPVTRESWRIGIFSTHQRGTLKNGTRILFTVSREEEGKLFDTERNGSGGVEVETVSNNKRGGKTSGRNVPGIEPTRWNSRTDIFNHHGRISILRISFQFLFLEQHLPSCLLHYIFPSTETLLSWDFPDAVGRSTNPQSQCLCQTSNCLCCIDLNLTATFDLGGPACINVRQKEQNVSLNLSYGDNPVHNATIKIGETDLFFSKSVFTS